MWLYDVAKNSKFIAYSLIFIGFSVAKTACYWPHVSMHVRSKLIMQSKYTKDFNNNATALCLNYKSYQLPAVIKDPHFLNLDESL